MAELPLPGYPDTEALQRDRSLYYGPQTARDQWYNYPGTPETVHPRMIQDIATVDLLGQLVNGYDGGIAYIDEAVARILETLESLGVRDETAIVVSVDHGEAIGELGMYFEHGNATEGVTRVPLIVAWPGGAKGAQSEALIYQLDLGPTILELLGLAIPDGWDGASFAAALRGDAFDGRAVIVRGCGIYSFQRAIRCGDWLLIQTLHSGLYPLKPVYLFNLREDPHERVNLADVNRGKRLELQGVLAEWWGRYCTGPDSTRDPFQLSMDDGPDQYYPAAKLVAHLRSTARDDQLHDLQRRRPDLAIE
jgi:arylsulfatase A-like enzyme